MSDAAILFTDFTLALCALGATACWALWLTKGPGVPVPPPYQHPTTGRTVTRTGPDGTLFTAKRKKPTPSMEHRRAPMALTGTMIGRNQPVHHRGQETYQPASRASAAALTHQDRRATEPGKTQGIAAVPPSHPARQQMPRTDQTKNLSTLLQAQLVRLPYRCRQYLVATCLRAYGKVTRPRDDGVRYILTFDLGQPDCQGMTFTQRVNTATGEVKDDPETGQPKSASYLSMAQLEHKHLQPDGKHSLVRETERVLEEASA